MPRHSSPEPLGDAIGACQEGDEQPQVPALGVEVDVEEWVGVGGQGEALGVGEQLLGLLAALLLDVPGTVERKMSC